MKMFVKFKSVENDHYCIYCKDMDHYERNRASLRVTFDVAKQFAHQVHLCQIRKSHSLGGCHINELMHLLSMNKVAMKVVSWRE